MLKAEPGDFLVVASSHLEQPPRIGFIQEVHGEDGAPPYVVKWEEDGRTTTVFPGSDAHIERRPHDPAHRLL